MKNARQAKAVRSAAQARQDSPKRSGVASIARSPSIFRRAGSVSLRTSAAPSNFSPSNHRNTVYYLLNMLNDEISARQMQINWLLPKVLSLLRLSPRLRARLTSPFMFRRSLLLIFSFAPIRICSFLSVFTLLGRLRRVRHAFYFRRSHRFH